MKRINSFYDWESHFKGKKDDSDRPKEFDDKHEEIKRFIEEWKKKNL